MAKQDLVFTPTAENLPSALAKVQSNTDELYTAVTGAAIKTAYEAQANAFTDTKNTKLTGIETSATADQTGAEIKTAYEAEANAFTDTKNTKLAGIATGATANATDASLLTRANHTGTQAASTITGLGTLAMKSSVSLTTEVSGVLPVANYATGTATGTKFVRDDGVLAVPSVASSGEGTAVASTGETIGKVLTADGADGASWEEVTGSLSAGDQAKLDGLNTYSDRTASPYTVTAADFDHGKTIEIDASALTIPALTSAQVGKFINVRNVGTTTARSLTAGSGVTINEAIAIPPGAFVSLYCDASDGTNAVFEMLAPDTDHGRTTTVAADTTNTDIGGTVILADTHTPTLHVVTEAKYLWKTITFVSDGATELTIGAGTTTLKGLVKINQDEYVVAQLTAVGAGTATVWRLAGGSA